VIRALRRAYLRSGLRGKLPHGLKVRGRRVWIRVARRIGYPIHSPLLPPPPLPKRRTPLRLTHVVVACDLNPGYVDSWPLIRRAWPEIAGIEPVLVLVAAEEDAPPELLSDPQVVRFTPIEGLHTAFQAQCIRLLYPALLEVGAGVLISDMELVPLDPSYFHAPAATLDERFFVAYRDVLLPRGELAIAYNAARPETWAEVFSIRGEDDVRARLSEWAAGTPYDGSRGGSGWYTDQLVLHETALAWGKQTGRLWLLDDDYTGHRRLDRIDMEREGVLTPAMRRGLLRRAYADFHCLVPHSRFEAANREVVELALAAGERDRGSDILGPRWRRRFGARSSPSA
jgi:hypothetical protein